MYAGLLMDQSMLSTYEPDVIEALEYVQTQDADGAYNMPSGLSSTFTEEEQEIILDKMEEYCMQETGKTLQELWDSYEVE